MRMTFEKTDNQKLDDQLFNVYYDHPGIFLFPTGLINVVSYNLEHHGSKGSRVGLR